MNTYLAEVIGEDLGLLLSQFLTALKRKTTQLSEEDSSAITTLADEFRKNLNHLLVLLGESEEQLETITLELELTTTNSRIDLRTYPNKFQGLVTLLRDIAGEQGTVSVEKTDDGAKITVVTLQEINANSVLPSNEYIARRLTHHLGGSLEIEGSYRLICNLRNM